LFCYQVKTLLRCVLCLHVSISRANFFNHLKIYHNRRSVGLCCPFCNDDVEKPTRQAFDHFIDNHYNVALKRAGEAALVRGRIQLQAQAAASRSAAAAAAGGGFVGNNINIGRNMTRLTRPVVQQQRRSMPLLRPKTAVPSPVQQQTASTVVGGVRPNAVRPQTIRVPVSQMSHVLRMNSPNLNVTNAVIGGNNYLTRPIIIDNRGLTQIPLGFTVVSAPNIQTNTINNSLPVTAEPMDTTTTTTPSSAAEDSILGM
jgi:hypothetical protein